MVIFGLSKVLLPMNFVMMELIDHYHYKNAFSFCSNLSVSWTQITIIGGNNFPVQWGYCMFPRHIYIHWLEHRWSWRVKDGTKDWHSYWSFKIKIKLPYLPRCNRKLKWWRITTFQNEKIHAMKMSVLLKLTHSPSAIPFQFQKEFGDRRVFLCVLIG